MHEAAKYLGRNASLKVAWVECRACLKTRYDTYLFSSRMSA